MHREECRDFRGCFVSRGIFAFIWPLAHGPLMDLYRQAFAEVRGACRSCRLRVRGLGFRGLGFRGSEFRVYRFGV